MKTMVSLAMLMTLVIVIGLAPLVYAQGTLQHIPIDWPSLDEIRDIGVYTPIGYADSLHLSYPVIYFLHGCLCPSNDYTLYWGAGGLKMQLDLYIYNGLIPPAIVVSPDACAPPYCGSYYTSSELYGNFEDYIVEDVVAFIDSTYRTITDRDCRAILGHSMGGYGAMKLALKNADVFGVAGSHAGPLDIAYAVEVQREPLILPENPGPPYTFNPENGIFTLINFARSGALSPNMFEPFFVDFPLDENGDLVDSVLERWRLDSPPRLAAELVSAGQDPPRIWFDCGTNDGHLEYPVNEAFADSLDALFLPFTFESHDGVHETLRWDRSLPAMLDCAPLEVAVGLDTPSMALTLSQNFPNPFNPRTTISFTLGATMWARVAVYETSGRQLAVLAERSFVAGTHSVVWMGQDGTGRAMPSGTYIVRLETESGVEARKVSLIR